MESERFGTVVIVGVGLIGGSIGAALRTRQLADRVIGVGRDQGRLQEAVQLGAIDSGSTDLSTAVVDAEVAVVCTPVSRIAQDVRSIARSARDPVLITDAGSTKQQIISTLEADERSRRLFVGAHPLAGSERRGVAHARHNLFENSVCVLTPTDQTSDQQLIEADRFWSSLGCRTIRLNPEDHDRALGRTSHLPHVLASALALTVPIDELQLAAGSYRDGTRVAASDPALWADIFLENKDSVLGAISEFEAQLDQLREAIELGNRGRLIELGAQARDLRLRRDEVLGSTHAVNDP